MFKKVLCGILAAVLLLCACACGTNTEQVPDEQPEQTSGEASTVVNEETETRESLDIPDTRYDGTELVFLTRDESEWSTTEIFAEKDSIKEDVISDAVYTRNDMIYQNYGVTIKDYPVNTGEVPSIVQREVQATSGDFQAVTTNVNNSAGMTTNALIWNLMDDRINMDLEKSWWDQKLVEGFSMNDMLFFATGDLLTLDNDATFVMMFNKTIATECQLPNLYEMVDNYQWTFDKLFEYEQMAIEDPDGDGVLQYDSGVCGFALTNDVFYSMFYAGGLSVVSKDQSGELIFSLDVARAQEVADSAKRIFAKDYIVNINDFSTSTGEGVPEVGKTCFGESHALFFGEVLQCVERMRGFDVDFGVIPYPMYDANQKEYYHMMHTTGSVVCIPRSVDADIEMVSSMIEAMAYYAQDTLTKQYYEINLTTKNVKDEQSGPMIDLILESRVCDLAYYFGWSSALPTLTDALKPDSTKNVASSAKALSKSVDRQMKKAIEDIEKKYNS